MNKNQLRDFEDLKLVINQLENNINIKVINSRMNAALNSIYTLIIYCHGSMAQFIHSEKEFLELLKISNNYLKKLNIDSFQCKGATLLAEAYLYYSSHIKK